jgi:NAD(P)-dependent dehydrogenase (short-subunit alcohol dehydrogenase family)
VRLFRANFATDAARAARILFDSVVAAFGGALDVLVLNAGRFEEAPVDTALPAADADDAALAAAVAAAAAAPAGARGEDDSAFEHFSAVWNRTLSLNSTAAASLLFLAGRYFARRALAARAAGGGAAAGGAVWASTGSAGARGADGALAGSRELRTGSIVVVGSRGAFRGEPRAWP